MYISSTDFACCNYLVFTKFYYCAMETSEFKHNLFFWGMMNKRFTHFLAFAQSVFVVVQCSTSVRYVCNLALNVNSWKNYCTRRHGTALLSNVNCDLMLFRLCNFELFYTKIINVNSSGSILRTKGSLSKQLTCATLLRCILKFQKSWTLWTQTQGCPSSVSKDR